MFVTDLTRESTFSFPKIQTCPRTYKKEIEKNLELSDKREKRSFKMIGGYLEWNGFLVITKRLA